MKLPLAYYGNPILRKKALPVQAITDELKQFIQDMIETMEANRGIGLAAPQVNKLLAVFITCVPIEGPDDTWMPGKLKIFINPKIISYTKEEWACAEGCLSIPGVYGEISRPLKVKVEATNLEGQRFEEEFVGLEAHCVMHENDHLNGVLHIDRMKPKERKDIENLLRHIKKKFSSHN